jgi:thymidylate synthase (FAD)
MKSSIELIEVMGNDLTVVNAARVSFSKKMKKFKIGRDDKLIRYLAKHGHWTPFGHVQLQFYIKAPVFVARQLIKHQVGLIWNEVSRRYVDTEVEFYEPAYWRERAENKKQGSGINAVKNHTSWENKYDVLMKWSKDLYEEMLEGDIAPEQARMLLPQSMMTEWYWTGSLAAFARVCKLRNSDDAQVETREVTTKIAEAIDGTPDLSISWEALTNE